MSAPGILKMYDKKEVSEASSARMCYKMFVNRERHGILKAALKHKQKMQP